MAKVLAGIRLEEDTMEALKELAKKKKRTTSQIIRLILENYVEKLELL